jgi:putative endonuclease
MHFVYILYSFKLNKYYVGESVDAAARVDEHNNCYYAGAWTSKANDWTLKKVMSFDSVTVARRVETFIKRMKSRKFIEKLIEDSEWLEKKFNAEGHSPDASGRIL